LIRGGFRNDLRLDRGAQVRQGAIEFAGAIPADRKAQDDAGRRGHRIGYGAGYYDRTLAGLRAIKPIHAVGVAYGVCEVAAVPYEAHDQSLDAIVTDQETLLFPAR